MTDNSTGKKQVDDDLNSSGPWVVDLGRNLDIRAVKGLHRQLTGLNADSFMLDASVTSKVDACGLQLLAVFVQRAENEGKSVEWLFPDENLCHAATLLGLSESLHLP